MFKKILTVCLPFCLFFQVTFSQTNIGLQLGLNQTYFHNSGKSAVDKRYFKSTPAIGFQAGLFAMIPVKEKIFLIPQLGLSLQNITFKNFAVSDVSINNEIALSHEITNVDFGLTIGKKLLLKKFDLSPIIHFSYALKSYSAVRLLNHHSISGDNDNDTLTDNSRGTHNLRKNLNSAGVGLGFIFGHERFKNMQIKFQYNYEFAVHPPVNMYVDLKYSVSGREIKHEAHWEGRMSYASINLMINIFRFKN